MTMASVFPSDPGAAVSVIVPTFNEKEHINAFLDSLETQTYPPTQIEYIIVDGGSTDGTREILDTWAKMHHNLTIVDNPRRYVPHALNLALDRACGEVIIRMDVHAIYPKNYLELLVHHLDATGADNVGGVLETRPAAPGSIPAAIAAALSSPFGVGNVACRIGTTKPKETDTVPFGSYRREVFDRIGRFDEELLRNQDDEFNGRLRKAGGKIVLIPEIKITYFARKNFFSLASMMYQYGYFKPLVNAKLGKAATWRQFAPPLLIAGTGMALIQSLVVGLTHSLLLPLLFFYALFLCAGTFTCGSARLKKRICMAMAMGTMHFSYGLGYLRGIVDHVLLKKKKTRHISQSR